MSNPSSVSSATHRLGHLFRKWISIADPSTELVDRMTFSENLITIDDLSLDISGRNIWLIGLGKSCCSVAATMLNSVGLQIAGGVLITNEPALPNGQYLPNLKLLPGDHPIPAQNSTESTSLLLEFIGKANSGDLLIAIVSGGTSAMLCSPAPGVDLKTKQSIHQKLLNSGATISEINTVRKLLSSVKGGKLLGYTPANEILNILISDVPDNDPGTIGSGPTVPSLPSQVELNAIYDEYFRDDISNESMLLKSLIDKIALSRPEVDRNSSFKTVHNILLATPKTAVEKIRILAPKIIEQVLVNIYPEPLTGDVNEYAEKISFVVTSDCKNSLDARGGLMQKQPPRLYVFYGESEVKVKGNGTGGRNHHLALLLATDHLEQMEQYGEVSIMSVGTDGLDGSTGAAGVIIDREILKKLGTSTAEMRTYLREFRSGELFQGSSAQVVTGPTGINFMDLHLILIE